MKLIDYKEGLISRGSVFRLPAKWPYDNYVDFMVFETQEVDTPYGLIVSSGYKAGLFLVKLPRDSVSKEGYGLSTDWVINNWEYWIYPDCDVVDVHIVEPYMVSSID